MKSYNTHKKNRGPIILIFSLLFFFAIIIFFVRPAYRYLNSYLSKSEEVNANILLVEGWIPDYAIMKAYDEFKKNKYDFIVTSGLKMNLTNFKLSENGYLIFYPKKEISGLSEDAKHSIEVVAYSELEGSNRAHFNFYINNSLIGDFYAERSTKRFKIAYEGKLSSIDSVMIQFTNDDRGDFGDRNLYVKNMIIDDKVTVPLKDSEFRSSSSDGLGRISNNYNSNAEFVRNKLIALGVDSTKIYATSGAKVKINRTLTSALAFRDWLKTADMDVKGINIFTVGAHARRTWMTYNKILNEKYQIGIISVQYRSREIKVLKTLRETIGILYYWLILIPY